MSLVEDARRVMDRAVRTSDVSGKRGTACHLCSWARVYWGDEPIEHSPDCPVPALPKIVAALKAAERLHAAVGDYPMFDDYNRVSVHIDLIEAITDALRGNEVTA